MPVVIRAQTPFKKIVDGLTPKQIAFCNYRVEGRSMLDAYELAGYSMRPTKHHIQIAAHKLNNHPKLKQAIADLQELANTRAEVTRDDLVGFLLQQREAAFEEGQFGAANQAVMGVAKIMGLEINKSEVKHTHSYEVEQATQELFNMLSRRDRLPKAIDVTPDANDAE